MPFSLLKSAPDTAGAPTRWAWRQGDVRQKWAGMKRLRCHRISQFPQALDALCRRRMRAQPGGFRVAPSGQQPGATLPLDLGERQSQSLWVAGQFGGEPVGVEFAHPRQTQLRQQRELRRNGQQQQRRPLDSDCAPQQGRQAEEEHDLPQQGQKMGEPADGIGQVHDTQILVRNMRDFVAEHAAQLTGREATQQTVGQRDGRVMLRTGGEGVDAPAGHVVRYRHGRQPGPRRQFAQHSPKIGRFIRVQRACAIQQTAGDGGNPEQGQHQQRGLQAIEPAMPRAGSLRVAPITMAHLGFPRRPGHRARAAASKSPRGPASRLRAPRSWRGWSPGRGSRTCAPGRSARSGSPS